MVEVELLVNTSTQLAGEIVVVSEAQAKLMIASGTGKAVKPQPVKRNDKPV